MSALTLRHGLAGSRALASAAASTVRISLRDVPELDDEAEMPRPPAYPPPPTVLQQDRIADEVQRILSRRNERRHDENFIRRLSGGDLRTPAPAAPSTPHRVDVRLSYGKISSFSSRTADSADLGVKNSVELKAARIWNDIVQSAEKRR